MQQNYFSMYYNLKFAILGNVFIIITEEIKKKCFWLDIPPFF